MIRFIIPLIAVILFYLEPVFGKFSPINVNDTLHYMVPRFLIMYLIFVSIYYSKKRGIMYGLFLDSCMMCITLILLDYIQFYIH